MQKQGLSAKEIAHAFGVSMATAYRVLSNVDTIRIGRCVRVSPQELQRAIQENGGRLPTAPTASDQRTPGSVAVQRKRRQQPTKHISRLEQE